MTCIMRPPPPGDGDDPGYAPEAHRPGHRLALPQGAEARAEGITGPTATRSASLRTEVNEVGSSSVLVMRGARTFWYTISIESSMIGGIEVPLERGNTDATRDPQISPAANRPLVPDGLCHRHPRPSSDQHVECATERCGGMPRVGEPSGAIPPEPRSRSCRQRPVSDDVLG